MPNSNLCFRAICGSFYWTFQGFMKKRAQHKFAMRQRVVRVSGPVAVTLVFLVTFLLQCGDVEVNPGPPKSTRQSTLTSQSHQAQSPGGASKGNVSSDSEPTIADVVNMLSAMGNKIDNMHSTMQDQMNKIQTNIKDVMQENHELKDKVENLEAKLDDLEGRNRRKNLLFHGIPEKKEGRETWEECENAVKSVLKDKLGMGDVDIERAHRLRGGKAPHPIIASFDKYKDKESILTNCRKQKGKMSDVYISEDFTPRVRDQRRKLLPFLREAKQAQKRAVLRFDTLVIEGKPFVFDPATNKLREKRAVS